MNPEPALLPAPSALPTPLRNHKQQAAHEWMMTLTHRRMVVAQHEDTDIYVAKVKGWRRFAASAASGVEAECACAQLVYAFAYDLLVRGQELPLLEQPALECSPAVTGLIRLTRLKDILRHRAKDWGRTVKNVPTATVAQLLNEFDASITRTAMKLR